jgi:hypothetical protein
VLAIIVIAMGGTYFPSSRQDKRYVASGTMRIQIAGPVDAVSNPAAAPSSVDLANGAHADHEPDNA